MDRFIYRRERPESSKRESVVMGSFLNNIVAKVVILSISVFLLYNVVHSINITIQKVNILSRARMEVDSLRLKNLELDLLLENMQSIEYLEVQARDRLNFAGEKEYIFVIPENVLNEAEESVDALLAEGKQETEVPTYEVWKEFLLNEI